tara:strand:+ start:655 stop:822 length:168 start_codon:yes stop_codon:yes gene_type:complete
MKKLQFKKRILGEYLDLSNKILKTATIVDENNYFDLSRQIERDVQRMIGRLKYRG